MKSDVDQLASSVDAERAFSGGRLQVNHLQHDVSLQTFRAQMAVGSWYNTPLMNDLRTVTSIMRTKMEKGKGKASGKEGGNEVVKASYIVPRVTRTTCGLVRGLTRTHDALTQAGTGRPLKILVPAGWVRV